MPLYITWWLRDGLWHQLPVFETQFLYPLAVWPWVSYSMSVLRASCLQNEENSTYFTELVRLKWVEHLEQEVSPSMALHKHSFLHWIVGRLKILKEIDAKEISLGTDNLVNMYAHAKRTIQDIRQFSIKLNCIRRDKKITGIFMDGKHERN